MASEALILGIETSCDDTGAAVYGLADEQPRLLSNIVWTDFADHAAFGGVVPEIAARSHVERIDLVVARALDEAGAQPRDLAAVAATGGPGLVGAVMVGLTAAKAIALATGAALIPINHLEGHALSARMTEDAPFPYLLLLISGGHTQLTLVRGLGAYERVGASIDDAAGEAFDKTAKLLDLGQPGGPRIEALAASGRADRFALPAPIARRKGCDFSFAGLKTAVRLLIEREGADPQSRADIAASFQRAAADHLASRTARAMDRYGEEAGRRLVVAGGVAANCAIKASLRAQTEARGWRLIAPPAKFCTDNGAMIAWTGLERWRAGLLDARKDALAFAPRPRWPLAPPPAGQAIGGGRKGPRA